MLTAEDINQYVCTAFQNIKASSIGRYITSLRNFFRFLEYKRYVINRSALELPLTSADWQKSNVSIILTSDEEKRLRFHYKNDEEMGIRKTLGSDPSKGIMLSRTLTIFRGLCRKAAQSRGELVRPCLQRRRSSILRSSSSMQMIIWQRRFQGCS